jgi:hypothetical protein
MPDFGIMRGFNEKLFGDKLVAGQLPTQLGLIGSQDIGSLLLDFYPNSAAAYSLRKLRLLYTGNAIRVRRSSDNTEQNIGFTALGDLDTTSLTSFCSGTNGFVTTWYDQSGNGRNATQTTATNQPQIVSGGSVILENSKPSVQFDGSNDYMQLNFNDKVQSIFVVASKNTSNFQDYNGFITYRASPNFLLPPSNERGGFTGIKNINAINGLSATSIYINNLEKNLNNYLTDIGATLDYSTTHNLISHFNNASAVGTKNIALGADVYTLGGLRYLNGNIGEVILYSSDESSNRTGIEGNINSFYYIY